MITRVYTKCPGCETPTILRIGVGVTPGERQPFAVRCPSCESMIRGQLITTVEAEVSVRLDEASFVSETAFEDWQVITTHPDFPSVDHPEISPFIYGNFVLGDAYPAYLEAVGQLNAIAEHDWPKLERAYQFYLAENWARFDTAMSRLLEEKWPAEPSTLMRHDVIHRLVSVVLLPLDPGSAYPELKENIWRRAQPAQALMEFLRQSSVEKEILSLQKRMFGQIDHMVSIRRTWIPAVLFLWANRLGRPVPEDWRLPGEDFVALRDVYRQNFELSCQALYMLVAIQNVADGRPATIISRANDAGAWVPNSFPGNSPPRTLAQFKKLTAEAKISFLDRLADVEEAWHEAFDRRIRNAIAHADVDVVTSSSEIVTGKGDVVSYMEFVESVVKQLQLLMLWLDLAKLLRIYGLAREEMQT
jgi:hypothetical protein